MSDPFRKTITWRAVVARLLFFILSVPLILSAGPDLRELAEQGDLNAMRHLGDAFFYGTKSIRQNYSLAAYWYRKGAEKGDRSSMFNYGVCLERGLGVKKDSFAAFDWFKKAAEKGLKIARYNVAMTMLSGIPGDPENEKKRIDPSPGLAMLYLERLADERFLPAEVMFAELCLEQRNDPEYLKKALVILNRLNEQKNPPPQVLRMLADCKYGGLGMPRDIPGMVRLLERAEAQGDGEAAGKLAYCYEYGRGVAVDPKRAFELYRIGAERGNAMSAFKYAEMLLSGKYTKDPELEKALRYYHQAADAGNPQAMTKLGLLHLEGLGVEKSEEAAAKYFFQASKKNYAHAQYNLACMFSTGAGGLIKDEAAAVYWYRLAARGGDPAAARTMAVRYFEGKGVPRSVTRGEYWLNQAIQLGDEEAVNIRASRNRILY